MRNRTISWIILAFALLFVGTSVWFTHHLSQQFAEVEQQRMEVWAEATRLLVLADENTDISLYSSIIEANTTIPVYMTDADYHVILTRNVQEPKQDVEAFYRKKIERLRANQAPIEVNVSPGVTQYIFSSTASYASSAKSARSDGAQGRPLIFRTYSAASSDASRSNSV